MIMASNGPSIKSSRKKMALSREVFASIMGVTMNSVARWERDEVEPVGEALDRVRLFMTLVDDADSLNLLKIINEQGGKASLVAVIASICTLSPSSQLGQSADIIPGLKSLRKALMIALKEHDPVFRFMRKMTLEGMKRDLGIVGITDLDSGNIYCLDCFMDFPDRSFESLCETIEKREGAFSHREIFKSERIGKRLTRSGEEVTCYDFYDILLREGIDGFYLRRICDGCKKLLISPVSQS
jgi:transcriptional regulator with XRE-family HTH domain